jgi:hypothetical protein
MAGCNEGTITHCSASGQVRGEPRYIGVLAGGNTGTIEDCRTSVGVGISEERPAINY